MYACAGKQCLIFKLPFHLVHSKKRVHLDDPVGAVGAHAVAASWGIFAVGLFANSQFEGIDVRDGLFHGGGLGQLGSQCLEIVAIIAWSIAAITPFFYIVVSFALT